MKPVIEDVRDRMNARYLAAAPGSTYETGLIFDAMRFRELDRAVLSLAWNEAHDRCLQALDVGSGEGGIAAYWPHQNVYGLELSAVAVARARERFPDATFEVGAIEEWDPRIAGRARSFRLVVARETIEHWVDVPRGLENLRRALTDGAVLVITTPNRDSLHCRIGKKLGRYVPKCCDEHQREFGYEELQRLLRQHGFAVEQSRGVGLAPYWALEDVLGDDVRHLTDYDADVNSWLNDIGRWMPAEYAFIQCHRARAV